MVKENISYEQHKLDKLHKQLVKYSEMLNELNTHCKEKNGISLTQLEEFTSGVKKDIQKIEQLAMTDGVKVDLSEFKDRIDTRQ